MQHTSQHTSPTITPVDDDIYTPLVTRVARVLDAIPDEIKARGIALAYICERLRGVKGRKPHSGSVGDCLRALKWDRRRGWKAGRTGFQARWYPPA